MKSFNELYQELQDQTGDDSSTQLTIFKRWINDTQQIVLGDHSWKFLEKTANITTEADTGRYEIPANIGRLKSVVTLDSNSDVDQTPEVVEDPYFWEHLERHKASSSDTTQYVYQEGNDLLTWPDFSTAGLTIRVRGRKEAVEMTLADYTSGTITTATNGSTAIVGSSTSWNSQKPLGEQWMRIDKTAGDYKWYQIATITDDTNIVLDKNYIGTSIAAGSSTYTIGEFPVIPGKYHNICFYRPMALYYMKMENMTMANHYWNLYDGGYEISRARKPGGLVGKLIKHESGAVDSKYFPPQGQSGAPLDSEFLAKDTTSTLG